MPRSIRRVGSRRGAAAGRCCRWRAGPRRRSATTFEPPSCCAGPTASAKRDTARELGVSRASVIKWERRLPHGGPGGAWPTRRGGDASRASPRRCASGSSSTRRARRRTAPAGPVRSMADAAGVSKATVQRLWRANDIRPHAVRTFKLSNDKHFDRKFWDVVGLCLNPPDRALALCCDEKSQCQALERTPARLSRHARLQPHADARLQTARHRHAVRRAVPPGRQDLQPHRRQAHAPAVAGLSAPPQPGGPARPEPALDRRQLRHPQAPQGAVLDPMAQPALPQDARHRPGGHALHAHVQLLDEPGGALLQRPHPGRHPRRQLHQRRRGWSRPSPAISRSAT